MKKKVPKIESEKNFEFGQVMAMLEQMSDGIGVIAEDQGEIKNRLGSLEGKVDRLQEDMDIVKSDISKIKTDLKRKVDYDEFEKLEKRMIKVERLVFAKH